MRISITEAGARLLYQPGSRFHDRTAVQTFFREMGEHYQALIAWDNGFLKHRRRLVPDRTRPFYVWRADDRPPLEVMVEECVTGHMSVLIVPVDAPKLLSIYMRHGFYESPSVLNSDDVKNFAAIDLSRLNDLLSALLLQHVFNDGTHVLTWAHDAQAFYHIMITTNNDSPDPVLKGN